VRIHDQANLRIGPIGAASLKIMENRLGKRFRETREGSKIEVRAELTWGGGKNIVGSLVQRQDEGFCKQRQHGWGGTRFIA
jgi:hypothetical protein